MRVNDILGNIVMPPGVFGSETSIIDSTHINNRPNIIKRKTHTKAREEHTAVEYAMRHMCPPYVLQKNYDRK